MLSNTHFAMAVHLLIVLAYADKLVGSQELAQSVGTNASFLRGLIGRLREAGLVETQMGKGGGTRLARTPSEISLKDVHRAVESQPTMKAHQCSDESLCPVASKMSDLLSEIEGRVADAVDGELQKTNIAQLLKRFCTKPSE